MAAIANENGGKVANNRHFSAKFVLKNNIHSATCQYASIETMDTWETLVYAYMGG